MESEDTVGGGRVESEQASVDAKVEYVLAARIAGPMPALKRGRMREDR